ncbi:hypothetical protein AB0C93_05965 [Streptomyces sp. NPDC048518]|uniref:hypothetical protein n=1 Tax=Streptomyces sp. NPDC048518 TaxID=3155029 RepID=UPI00340EC687
MTTASWTGDADSFTGPLAVVVQRVVVFGSNVVVVKTDRAVNRADFAECDK